MKFKLGNASSMITWLVIIENVKVKIINVARFTDQKDHITLLKTTIKKITSSQVDDEKTENNIKEKEEIIVVKKKEEEIVVAKKKEMALLNRQKEISAINIQGKTLNQLIQDFGKPDLIREDGNTKAVRFNTSSCRLFIYFDLELKKPKAEYYEIRNTKGELIDKKEKINKCFEEIQKT